MRGRTACPVVWLAIAVCACHGEAQEELRLALGPSRLVEALEACSERFAVEYLAIGIAEAPKEPFIKAGCVEDLMEELLAMYGASGIGFDGLWFVDARGATGNRWEALERLLPGEVREAFAAGTGEDQWPAARDNLEQLLEAKVGPNPQVPAGNLLVAPFEVSTQDAPPVQVYRLRRAVTSLRRFLSAPPPEATGTVRLDEHRGLWLADAQKSIKIIDVPQQWQTSWRDPTEGVARPHLELHGVPLVVQRAAVAPLGEPVSAQAKGATVADFVRVLADQSRIPVTGPKDLMELRVAARFKDVPFWLALAGLSIASGFAVDLSAAQPEYTFATPEGPAEALYQVSRPAERLYQRHLRQASHGRPFPMWAWLALDDNQRGLLGGGQPLAVEGFSARQRWMWGQVLLSQREIMVWAEVSRIGPLLADRGSVRGIFLLDAQGDRSAGVRLHGGEMEGFVLGPPEAQRRRPTLLKLLADSQGVGLSADRRIERAFWWTYGSRREVKPHRPSRRGEPVLLAAPEVEEHGGVSVSRREDDAR